MTRSLPLLLLLLLAACGGEASSAAPSGATPPPASHPVSPTATASDASPPAVGQVDPAPGSASEVYPPNPGAIVVAIDAGHGGCLDWGVPDPSERGEELAEKTLTLHIARLLRDRLEADGIGVVMVRDDDVALAGDRYPELGCEGPPFRDVNGDGEAGFDPEGATRTRDELQARLDLANLAQADALVSVHINSPFDGGESIPIAFSETFYTDETPWGVERTAALADALQAGVVARLGEVADYERGDRGITAHNFYLVAPPLFEPTDERPDPVMQPTRGALMPTVLAEVGSITLREEHDLLASPEGQAAVADGLFEGLAAWFADRRTAARIGIEGAPAARVPDASAGDGPPYSAPALPDGPLRLRITNTGAEPMPPGTRVVAAWETSEEPYLRAEPANLGPIADPLPALAPGESAVVQVSLPGRPDARRAVAWISLLIDGQTASSLGSPALQLASEAP